MIDFENVQRFVEEELEALAGIDPNGKFDKDKIDRAGLSRLRRTLGKPVNRAFDAFPYVTKWTENVDEGWDMECYYLVASLFAIYQQGQFTNDHNRLSWHHDRQLFPADRNLGASFRRLELKVREERDKAGTQNEKLKGIEKRFTVLLKSRRADLPVRLRQAISYLASKEIPIDWVRLLTDLMLWQRSETLFFIAQRKASPQRSWAQSFYKLEKPAEELGE